MQTFIPGKDAALESTIETMQAKLAARASAYGEFFERLGTHYFWTPGFSEIYPVEDLEWENNSIGNAIRPKLVRLHELSEQE